MPLVCYWYATVQVGGSSSAFGRRRTFVRPGSLSALCVVMLSYTKRRPGSRAAALAACTSSARRGSSCAAGHSRGRVTTAREEEEAPGQSQAEVCPDWLIEKDDTVRNLITLVTIAAVLEKTA